MVRYWTMKQWRWRSRWPWVTPLLWTNAFFTSLLSTHESHDTSRDSVLWTENDVNKQGVRENFFSSSGELRPGASNLFSFALMSYALDETKRVGGPGPKFATRCQVVFAYAFERLVYTALLWIPTCGVIVNVVTRLFSLAFRSISMEINNETCGAVFTKPWHVKSCAKVMWVALVPKSSMNIN